MTDIVPEPLLGDAARQAVPTLRGYLYQIFRTVLAWLDLPGDEVLYVEGAEDFDRVGRIEATTNQVKALRANLTLRSSDVNESIQNLWNLQRDNAGRSVAFRFLTTARPGREEGDPFGIPGLVFWNDLRTEADEAVRLTGAARMQRFLAARSGFSRDLAAFLCDADPTEVFTRLIAPLRFETGLDGIEGVEAEIRRRLVLLGERFGVPPTDAEKASDALLSAACLGGHFKTVRPGALQNRPLGCSSSRAK